MLRIAGSGTVACLSLIMLSAAAPAFAKPGDHIGTDNVQLIPSLMLTTQQRSNVFLQEGVIGGGEDVTAGTNLRIQPNITFKAENSDVLFSSSAGYTARKYFQSEISNLDRFRDFDIRGDVDLLRQSVVGLKLRERFQINGFESEADKADDPYIQILSNDLGARLAIRPGSSLEVDAGGNVSIDNYSGPDSNASFVRTGQNDRLGYGPAVDLKWRFLPKTALVGSFAMEWFSWENNVVAPSGNDGTENYIGIPDGRILRAEGGIRGRFTEKMVLGLTAGYGSALYDETSVTNATSGDQATGEFAQDLRGLQGVLLGVDLSYAPLDSQSVSLGYRKDFQDVFFTNYVAYNRVNFSYSGTFVDSYKVDLAMNYRFENYDGEVDRNDHRIITNGTFTYVATSYLDVSLGAGWRRRASADALNPDIEFDDVDVRLALRLTY